MTFPLPSDCDKEAIHTPGCIQGHGALLILEPQNHTIVALSANTPVVLDQALEASTLLGQPFARCVSASFLSSFQENLNNLGSLPGDRVWFSQGGLVAWEVTLVVLDTYGHIGVEVTPARVRTPLETFGTGATVHGPFHTLDIDEDSVSLDTLLYRACVAVRKVTGFDRVMVYRFLPGWHGEVVAEDKRAEAQSFFGHRFPASDIPAPARSLYLWNRVRTIPDAHEPAVPLLCLPSCGQEGRADLSHSRLRAVAPIHIEYMRNMGVRSSLSLAITNGDELWGLLACHGTTRAFLTPGDLEWCEQTALKLSKEVTTNANAERDAHARSFREVLSLLLPGTPSKNALCNRILSSPERFLSVFKADGCAWVQASTPPPTTTTIDHVGFTPRRDDLAALAKKVKDTGERLSVFETLEEFAPSLNARPSCGLLSVSLEEGVFFLFRNQALRQITWGGDPRKTLASRGFGGRVNPRQSFESYVEKLEGHAVPWSDDEQRAFRVFAEKLDALPLN